MQPGDTITPNQPPHEADDAALPASNAQPIAPPDQPVAAEHEVHKTAPLPEPESPTPDIAPEEASPWQYAAETTPFSNPPASTDPEPVTWTASEFVDHEKNSMWFIELALFTAVAVTVIYFLTRDIITFVAIILAACLFGVTAKRKPRTLQYQLDRAGVNIGGKPYPYDTFKSFTVLEEGSLNSIQLMSLKRFMPPISLYYPAENENQIINMLGSYLPHEDRARDPIDKLMRKVRF